jgi:hypothetical protein
VERVVGTEHRALLNLSNICKEYTYSLQLGAHISLCIQHKANST